MEIQKILQQLFQHPQFNLKLQDLIVNSLERVNCDNNHSQQVGYLIEDLNTIISQLIQFTIKSEINNLQALLKKEFNQFKQEILQIQNQKFMHINEKIIKQGLCQQLTQLYNRVQSIRSESLESILLTEQKLNSSKNLYEKLINNVDIKVNQIQRKYSNLYINRLSDIEIKQNQIQKSISEIQQSMIDIGSELHQKYSISIGSIWTVISQIEKKIQTESKPNPNRSFRENAKRKLNFF